MVHYNNRNKIKLKRPQPGSSNTTSAPSQKGSDESPAYKIQEIPGKGLGLVASRDLKAGDLVLKEAPLMTSVQPTTLASVEGSYSRLSQEDKKRFDALYIAEPNSWLPEVVARCKTNAIGLGVDSDVGGIFIEGSRFNHSCTANVHRAWDKEQEVEWFIAMKDIKKGTELTIAYKEFNARKEERQSSLRLAFGFDCSCEACSLTPEETLKSDARRIKIKEINDSMKPLRLTDPLKLIRDVKTAFSLMEEEGILEGRADFAFECLNVCSYNGDRVNTSLWIDKTLELDRCESGKWSSMYKQIEGWKGKPTRHPGWLSSASKTGVKTLLGPK